MKNLESLKAENEILKEKINYYENVYITPKQARDMLGLTQAGLIKLVKRGDIKANKINSRLVYYSQKSIIEFMQGVEWI